MKIKRYKHARKILSFYKTHFGLRQPYQIIGNIKPVDGTFCQAALKGKIQIKEQLPKYLGGPIMLVTTKCILQELQSLGSELKGAYYIANRFQQRSCGHRTKLPAAQCIDGFIGDANDHHYCVASQDPELKKLLRNRPGVPLLHIVRNTMVLESPSPTTRTKCDEISNEKMAPSEYEKNVISKLNESLPQTERLKRKRRKRPSAPNPLAVKKPKKQSVPDRISTGVVTTSKKRRIRIQRRKAIEHLAQVIQTDKH